MGLATTRAALALALAASSGAPAAAESASPEASLASWLRPALFRPDARLVVERIDAPAVGCRPAWNRLAGGPEAGLTSTGAADGYGVTQPLASGGRVAVAVPGLREGSACRAWIWARLRLYAPVPVATRSVHAGQPLSGAWAMRELELRPGFEAWEPASEGTADALADRSLVAGQGIGVDMVRRAGLTAGTPIKVLLIAGALSIEQSGTVVPCGRAKTCAVLPSGRHLEGRLQDGRLIVQTP